MPIRITLEMTKGDAEHLEYMLEHYPELFEEYGFKLVNNPQGEQTMPTVGIIATRQSSDHHWDGSYHNFDSDPKRLGASLWAAYHNAYFESLDDFVDFLVYKYGDWASVVDWNGNPDHVQSNEDNRRNTKHSVAVYYDDTDYEDEITLVCVNHLESYHWLYLFDIKTNTLTIQQGSNTHTISLLNPNEPDWHAIGVKFGCYQ